MKHMYKLGFLVLGLFALVNFSSGQTTYLDDNFDDGDIVGWTEGVSSDWISSTTSPINGTNSLKHNLSGVSETSNISFPISAADLTSADFTWQFQAQNGAWDPSSSNKFWVYLVANEADLESATVDGYAVGVNLTGSTDILTLWKVTNGAADGELISSSLDWNSGTLAGVQVTRTSSGEWELLIDTDGGFDALASAGTATNTDYTLFTHAGLEFAFSSSRAGLLWFDDITIESAAAATNTQVQFTSASTTVSEADGTTSLELSIINPDGSAATMVEVALTSGDAADIDTYTTQTVTFAAASSANETVTVTISDDAIAEGDETLTFTLQNIGGGNAAAIGSQSTYEMTILDNDLLAEPTNHVSSFMATAAGATSFDLSWTDNDGAEPAEAFLIKMSATSFGDIADPVDATEEADGSNTANVLSGVGTYSWSGLDSETEYFFKIYPYTNSGTDIDFKTDGTIPESSATTEAIPTIFMSEIADPSDDAGSRFVELYNPGASSVNLDGFYLSRQSNGGSTWGDIALTGTIAAGGTFVIANNSPDYLEDYAIGEADIYSTQVSSNGDDGYFLYFGGDHTTGVLYDAYGVVDQDGTGFDWEFLDSRAERNDNIVAPNTTWTLSEWTINASTVSTSDGIFTPAVHFACAPPATQASAINFTATGDNTTTINWTRGDGDGVLVLAKEGGAVDADPTLASTYTANAAFTSGDLIGGGNYVVYDGTGTSVAVTGLTVATTYHFAVFEYSGTGCYNLVSLTGSETTTGTDTDAPTLSGANTSAEGVSQTIVMEFNEAVTSTDESGFSVSINSTPATINGLTGSGTNMLAVTIDEEILSGDDVTVSYDDSSGDVQDAATNALVSFSDEVVSNLASTILVADVAALRAGATDGTVYRLGAEALVTFVTGNSRDQIFIQDGTGGILIDDDAPTIPTSTLVEGDGVSGFEGTLGGFGGVTQFVPTSVPTAITNGNEITPTTVTIADFNAAIDTYESQLLLLEEVTFTNADGTLTFTDPTSDYSTISDGTNTTTFDADGFLGINYSDDVIPYGRFDLVVLGRENSTVPIVTARYAADIQDNYAPLFTVAPSASNETIQGADITFQADEQGAFYFYALADGATAPTAAEVLSSGTSAVYTAVATDVVITVTGLDHNTAYDVYVLASDLAGNDGDTPVLVEFTTVEIIFDSDSDITAADDPIGASTISGLDDSVGEIVDVFAFKITDSGSGDSETTSVLSAVVIPGAGNTANWSSTLGGATLTDGTNSYTGVITDTEITFDMSGTPSVIAESGSLTYVLSAYTTGTVNDGEVLEFEIATAHNFSSDVAGSVIVTTLGAAITSAQHTIDVVATDFDITGSSTTALDADFSVNVTAEDANGNVDIAARNISISKTVGSGVLTGTGLTAQAMAAGTFSWSDLQLDLADDYTLTVDDDGSALTGTIDITALELTGGVFFSEYIEGSSNNKALEIYNGSGASIDLSNYSIKEAPNGVGFGNADPLVPYELNLSGTLEAGEVYVVYNGQAALQEILDAGDLPKSFGDGEGDRIAAFNGDDGIGLFANDILIDIIGDPDSQPADAWDVAGTTNATENFTLVRKGSITEGNTTALGSFGTNTEDSEWIVYPENTATFIGFHILDGEEFPLLAIDQSTFNGNFGLVEFGSSSVVSSYTVSGVDLTNDLVITPPAGFEITATTEFDGTVYTSSSPWTIVPVDGVVSQEVFVRYTPPAANGSSSSGDITHMSTDAETKAVAVSGTEGVFDSAPSLSGVVINEVLADPNGSAGFEYDTDGSGTANTEDEFVEIHNTSESPVDISGWQLFEEDGAFFTFPASTTLGAGNYAAIISAVQTGGALPTPSSGNLAFESDALSISNGGENIALYNPNSGEYIQMKFGDGQEDFDFSVATTGALVSIVEDWGVDTDGSSLVREEVGSLTVVVHGEIQGADAASFAEATIDATAPLITVLSDIFNTAFGNIDVDNESAVSTYIVSGVNLSSNVEISAPAQFLISSDGSTFSTSLSLAGTSGTLAETTISVKFAPVATGSHDGDIVHTTTDGAQIALSISGAGIGPRTLFFAGFGSCDDLNSFSSQSVTGDQVWMCNSNGETGDAVRMSGFNNSTFSADDNEDWLVSPALDLSSVSEAALSFDSDWGFSDIPLEVFVSADYSSDVSSATWTPLSVILDTDDAFDTWTSSGNVALPTGGIVYVGFKYVSMSDGDLSPTWTIDNFKVEELLPFFEVTDADFNGNFGQVEVGTPSSASSFSVDGFALTGTSVTVTPPVGFEVSLSSDFSSSVGTNGTPLDISISEGSVSDVVIYARLNPPTTGSFTGNIEVLTDGYSQIDLAVTGSAIGVFEVSDLNGDFNQQEIGTSSSAKTFTVTGSGLTEDVTITAPAPFEVSLSETFSGSDNSSVTISPIDGAVDNVSVYVRFSPTSAGDFTESVTVSTAGYDDVLLNVSGTGEDNSTTVLGLKDMEISIYPNPAASSFRVESSEKLTVSLFGIDGTKVNLVETKSGYDISQLSSGLYILKLSNDRGEEITHRIVKQ